MKTLIAHVSLKKLSLALTLCCVLLLPKAMAEEWKQLICPTCQYTMSRWVCPKCEGFGWYWEHYNEETEPCDVCNGTGKTDSGSYMIECPYCNGNWDDGMGNNICGQCDYGQIGATEEPCYECHGTCEKVIEAHDEWEYCWDCEGMGWINCPTCGGESVIYVYE